MLHNNVEFRLTDNFIAKFKGKQPQWGPLGFVTFKRSYARDKGNGRTEEYWETCQRVVEGTFLIQKLHCKQNHLTWNERKAQQSAQEMFKRMWEFKFLPPGRGLWAMGTDFVIEKSSAPLYNCFAGNEKFFVHHGLHNGGWECLTFKEAYARQSNVTVAHTGHRLATAEVRSFGVQPLTRVVLKPLHGNRTNYRHTIKVTPNHRWILSDGTETTALQVGDDIPINSFTGYDEDSIGVAPSWDSYYDMGFIHGMIFGDGTQNCHYPNRFMLLACDEKIQKNLYRAQQLPVWSDIQFVSQNTQRSTNGIDYPYLSVTCPRNLKALPTSGNYLYMKGFLEGWIAADGHTDNAFTLTLDSQNQDAANWLDVWAAVLGYPIVGRSQETASTNFGPRTSPLIRTALAFNPKKPVVFRVESITSLPPEEVFCAVVTEHKPKQFTLAGGLLTGNCGFISTKDIADDFSFPFVWLMDMSLMGVGVGFDTLGAASEMYLKKPRSTKDIHIIDDSREGWVEAFKRVLDAFTGNNTLPESFDYSQIRPAGSPIKTFGGIAPGPDPLRKLLVRTEEYLRQYVQEDRGVDSTLIVDLMNFAGACVVAGGTRRTAEIAFGNPHDPDFLSLKSPDKVTDPTLARWASNNSVTMEVGDDYAELAKQTMVNGEPGYLWLSNARHYGRLKDPRNEHDRNVMGTNPCGEITLNHAELCNIVETFPSNHSDLDDYLRTLKYAFLYSKTVTLLATHSNLTNQVQMKNRRIGVSQSGIVENINKIGYREHLRWCDVGYQELKKWDQIYSDWLCVRKSIKLTTVKPSGTVSLLPGKTPGIHYPHSEYYIRRMRVSRNSDLVQAMLDAGYSVVPDVYEKEHTMVIEFPVHEPNFSKRKADVSMWEQLELAAAMQSEWADNSVSITVTVKPDEVQDLPRALEMFETKLKSVSFLPLADHKYEQAPYEEIGKDRYNELYSVLRKPKFKTFEAKEAQFCDADVCEYKPPQT